MAHLWIALGSNLGVRIRNLAYAVNALREEFVLLGISSVYETEPWGVEGPQPPYLNAVLHADAGDLAPEEVLERLERIEGALGRDPAEKGKFLPRPLDADLLLYGDVVWRSSRLVLPHPRMWERPFVLRPLLDVSPDVRDPLSGETALSFWERLREVDRGGIRRWFSAEDLLRLADLLRGN
ncbi:2-amino-4-hydroxy-6-hydroxymethyldihydropteridine diphosphokinase [Brockia lithotrophica]|uniref:2-amino-4-hydroxy-6-hydroxymethyldihydropteridine diphosphokinase n=1 Tax=Brockia lithotrophica TaxID=933949 RepID=A0A660KZ26_9BACL|nr:2-amino-4-hydroxy-6-hydroxymethyldihydropteridine diphosphokinase [Brockia lithotrophica]RKQ85614.1 2-amino-4-hydroxy-6-hydroxymethyldihydropteridine diphosphokinase [Brockia lithotrophica]